MKDLKPLFTLRVKDGVAYANHLPIPEAGHSYYIDLDKFNNSFVPVLDDGRIKLEVLNRVGGDYDVSEMGMVFSVEEVPEFPGFDHTSYPTFKNVAICSLPEKKEVGSDETDFGVLCANLLMFAEADGTIVNGYRSKEIVQQIRKQLKH